MAQWFISTNPVIAPAFPGHGVLLLSKFREELHLRAGGKYHGTKWHRNLEKLNQLGFKFRLSSALSTCAKLLCSLCSSFFVNPERWIWTPWELRLVRRQISQESSWCFPFDLLFQKAQREMECESKPHSLSFHSWGKYLPFHGFMLIVILIVWIVAT